MLKAKTFTSIFTSINLLVASILLFTVVLAYSFPHRVAQDISQTVQATMTKEMDCLAKNIYYEAASESYEGKLAVAQVTLNRTNSGRYPNSICGVVYQKDKVNGKTVCQFSWVCEKVSAPRSRYLWEEAQYIARKALTEPIAHAKLAEKQVMYFHATYVHPPWKKNGFVIQIGNHIFYAKT